MEFHDDSGPSPYDEFVKSLSGSPQQHHPGGPFPGGGGGGRVLHIPEPPRAESPPHKRARKDPTAAAAFLLQDGEDDVRQARQMIEDGLRQRKVHGHDAAALPSSTDVVDPDNPQHLPPQFNVRRLLGTKIHLSYEDLVRNFALDENDSNEVRKKNAVYPPSEQEVADKNSVFFQKPVSRRILDAESASQSLEKAMGELSLDEINHVQRAVIASTMSVKLATQRKYERNLRHGYADFFDVVRGHVDHAEDDFKRRMTVRTRLAIALEPKVSYQGDLRFAKLLRMPAEIASKRGVRLEEIQMGFIREFTFACAPLVFREDWDVCKVSFFNRYGIRRIHQQVLAIAPRRFGKTWALAIFVLGLLLTCEGIVVCVFAQNERAARAIVNITNTFLSYWPNGRERLANDAAGEIHILPEHALKTCVTKNEKRRYPRLSKMIALPASVNSSKRHTKGAGMNTHTHAHTHHTVLGAERDQPQWPESKESPYGVWLGALRAMGTHCIRSRIKLCPVRGYTVPSSPSASSHMCAQLCRQSSPTAHEWYQLALYLPKSDREALNFMSRQRARFCASAEKATAAATATVTTTSDHDLFSSTAAPSVDLPGIAWMRHMEDGGDGDDDDDGGVDYFGNDPTKVKCPVPIDLQVCHIPRRPPSGQAGALFLPCKMPADSDLFYADLTRALYTQQQCIHPVTHRPVFPTWSAYLPRMFIAYDQVVALFMKRREDVVLCQCVARDLVFALVRHRQFSPGTAMVMYLVVGLCYYFAATRVSTAFTQALSPPPPKTDTATAASSDGYKTPVNEPASINRKARTPPALSSAAKRAAAAASVTVTTAIVGRVTFTTTDVPTPPPPPPPPPVSGGGALKWNLPMEWNDALIPFELFRYTAVQHAHASSAHWFHYTEMYAAISAYFAFSVSDAWSLQHYCMWVRNFTKSYELRDAGFKYHSRETVILAARTAVDTAFKTWYMRPHLDDVIKAYEDPSGPVKLLDAPLAKFHVAVPTPPMTTNRKRKPSSSEAMPQQQQPDIKKEKKTPPRVGKFVIGQTGKLESVTAVA